MNRRMFLAAGASVAATAAAPSRSLAALMCGPYNLWGVQDCTAGVESSSFDMTYAPQEESQWCWAACVAMVFAHHGYRVSQTRIVQETWGDIYNLPAQPQHILMNLNRPWVDDYGRRFSIQGSTFTSNAMTAAQDLARGIPLIIGSGPHAMVLTAVSYRRHMSGNGQLLSAIVRDPWPGRGKRFLIPQELAATHFLARIRLFPG